MVLSMSTFTKNGIELAYVVPVFFNQKNSQVLTDLLGKYAQYDQHILSKIRFIIVDDCSPLEVCIPANINLNYSLFRISSDIRWNQAGARNLGVVFAPCPKIILTDCDHVFPEALFRKILASPVPMHTLFRFRRENAQGQRIKSAYNIFYTSKALFFAALGYDETFCGHYGYEDVFFREFHRKIGTRVKRFSWLSRIVAPDINREDSYHSLIRDTTRNKCLLDAKREVLHGPQPYTSHSGLFLNFNYHKVQEQCMVYHKKQ